MAYLCIPLLKFYFLNTMKFKLNYAKLLENIPFCNNPAEVIDLETCFMRTQTSQLITFLENNMDNRKTALQQYSVEVHVHLNYSTVVHFTLFYWFKSRTCQSKSNRACAKGTWEAGKQQTWRLILRCAPVWVEIAIIFSVD